MDINKFLQAIYLTGAIFSLAGMLTEALTCRTPPGTTCPDLKWYTVLLSLIPVVNIIVAVCVWSSIIINDSNPPSSGCTC